MIKMHISKLHLIMSNNCWLWSFNTENEEKLTYFVIRSRKENMAYSKEKMLQRYT